MKIPFRFRKVPPYEFDGDGQFPDNRIVRREKRMMRKKQFKRYFKDWEKE
jgi:hypothetical protein